LQILDLIAAASLDPLPPTGNRFAIHKRGPETSESACIENHVPLALIEKAVWTSLGGEMPTHKGETSTQ
jgi:hypothetical protein